MRIVPLVIAGLISIGSAIAGDIREFDIRTIERLGNKLTRRQLQGRHQETESPIRERARQTAIEALKGKLFNISYRYEVLDDPDGNGFLVYALGQGRKPGDVVVHGHFRVSVAADGNRAKRVDALSHSVVIQNKNDPSPEGYQRVDFVTSQSVGTRPVETLVYASNLMKLHFVVATPPKGQVWFIENGKITRDKDKSASKPKK